jgi:hypothetical protein
MLSCTSHACVCSMHSYMHALAHHALLPGLLCIMHFCMTLVHHTFELHALVRHVLVHLCIIIYTSICASCTRVSCMVNSHAMNHTFLQTPCIFTVYILASCTTHVYHIVHPTNAHCAAVSIISISISMYTLKH